MMNAQELIKNILQSPAPSLLRFVGMVKEDTADANCILFAPGGNCDNWVTIPLSQIEGAELIRVVACKDHTHPLVTLILKEPEDAYAKSFASLAASVRGGCPPAQSQSHSQNLNLNRVPIFSGERIPFTNPAVPGAARGRRLSQGGLGIPESVVNTLDGDCQVAYYGCNSCSEMGEGWCRIIYYCDGFTYSTCDKCC